MSLNLKAVLAQRKKEFEIFFLINLVYKQKYETYYSVF